VDRIVSIAGFNFGDFRLSQQDNPKAVAATAAAWESAIFPIHGTSSGDLAYEALRCGADWNLTRLAENYEGRSMLLICGDEDDMAPPEFHHFQLTRAFRTAGVRVAAHCFDSGPGFTSVRLQLSDTILDWLKPE
jgi:predicted esterase